MAVVVTDSYQQIMKREHQKIKKIKKKTTRQTILDKTGNIYGT